MRIAVLVALAVATPAAAHDFYLAPAAHRVASGEAVAVKMFVGWEQEVDEIPRSNRRIERFETHLGDRVAPVEGKHGASPAGRIALAGSGVATIVYQSSHTDIELDAAAFEAYLVEEGLDDITAERARRGATRTPGRESYARYAKALVTVGDGDDGWDREVGLPAELVARTDPRAGGTARFQLVFDGKPRAHARVDLFRIEKARLHSVGHARTDADGIVALAIPGDGAWLVGTTLMRAAPPALGLDGEWESFWVSLAFETAPRSAGGCAVTDGGLGLALLVALSSGASRAASRRSRRSPRRPP